MLFTKHVKHKMVGPGYPCGGSGGRGGDVIVRCSGVLHSLATISGQANGSKGYKGKRQNLNGDQGEPSVILVPRGVIIRDLKPIYDYTGEAVRSFEPEKSKPPKKLKGDGNDSEDEEEEEEPPVRRPSSWEFGEVLKEMDAPGTSFVVAQGGRGGIGNTMTKPHTAMPGLPGQDRWVQLELKLVAEVGLVGKPNAGKSTLLGSLSRACPKIAPYPFTTVAPYVGRAEFVDGTSITIADVPGLVEGAHKGAGLGHEFLRHLERTKVLLYVVDVARGTNPFAEYLSLRAEVEAFSWEMAMKPCGIIANKCDLAPDVSLRRTDELFHTVKEASTPDGMLGSGAAPLFVRAMSARFGQGTPGLLQELRQILRGVHPEMVTRANIVGEIVPEDI